MNIYQIEQELHSIFDELEENGGELTDELAERLDVSQENFRSKCESYANVIKLAKADIALIDQEKKRLDDLKKSKTNLIERLSNIVITAIEEFGDTSKSGSKFLDYGTGKLSIRNTQKVELDDDKVEAISSEMSKALAYEAMLGNASNRECFTFEDIIERCKEHKLYMVDGEIDAPEFVTKEDIQNTVVEITFKEHIIDLMKGDGYNLIKNLFGYNTAVTVSPKIDKTQLKNELASGQGGDITIGRIVPNQTLTIK